MYFYENKFYSISFEEKMRSFLLIPIFLLTALITAKSEDFNTYFKDKTMRIDYYIIGDAKTNEIIIDQIYEYGIWAGSLKNLIDYFDNGTFYLKIYDKKSNKLIFSKGFDDYFREYQTTGKAIKGEKKVFHESAIIPSPKNSIILSIEKRDKLLNLKEIFRTCIEPDDISINREGLLDESIRIYDLQISGDSHQKVDIAILLEGYDAFEDTKAINDLQRMVSAFFSQEPFKSNKDKFNIRGVFKPSPQSGVDEPRAGIFKRTAIETTFNSLGSERYLLTENNRDLRNIAAAVPYDAIIIMVNSKQYGGGGIYNFYSTFTADNQFSSYLLLHEAGHSFAGLADEYYTSATAYDDFYSNNSEPKEPNITRLLSPKDLKWKDLCAKGIEIPTKWNKNEFDRADSIWQKERSVLIDKIAVLKKNDASSDEDLFKAEQDYAQKSKNHADFVDNFLINDLYSGKVGAFEGAGYLSTGMFRPMLDCIMFSIGKKDYCKVCENAILKMINYYSE